MAETVAVKEEEYAELLKEVQKVHGEIELIMEGTIQDINELNRVGGSFYAKELTPKISLLTNELQQMKLNMEQIFMQEENIIKSFVQVIDGYDVTY